MNHFEHPLHLHQELDPQRLLHQMCGGRGRRRRGAAGVRWSHAGDEGDAQPETLATAEGRERA